MNVSDWVVIIIVPVAGLVVVADYIYSTWGHHLLNWWHGVKPYKEPTLGPIARAKRMDRYMREMEGGDR